MSAHPPPVPPEQRAPHGGADANTKAGERAPDPGQTNFDEQGRTGNIRENTHNKGYQQDR